MGIRFGPVFGFGLGLVWEFGSDQGLLTPLEIVAVSERPSEVGFLWVLGWFVHRFRSKISTGSLSYLDIHDQEVLCGENLYKVNFLVNLRECYVYNVGFFGKQVRVWELRMVERKRDFCVVFWVGFLCSRAREMRNDCGKKGENFDYWLVMMNSTLQEIWV